MLMHARGACSAKSLDVLCKRLYTALQSIMRLRIVHCASVCMALSLVLNLLLSPECCCDSCTMKSCLECVLALQLQSLILACKRNICVLTCPRLPHATVGAEL